jgi:hypothetical protein
MAPIVSADAAARSFGTALSVRAIKVSASQLLQLPLPLDDAAWKQGARLAERLLRASGRPSDPAVAEFAAAMNQAYGVGADEAAGLSRWWHERWPRRK